MHGEEVNFSISRDSSQKLFRFSLQGSLSGDRLMDLEKSVVDNLNTSDISRCVLDLKQISFIDSKGISLCVRLFKLCSAKNVQFSLEVNESVYKILSSTNLTSVIPVKVM